MPCSDLGAHVDGFIAVVAHTIVLGATSEAKVTGRRADVVLAAHYASQAALRLLKPDNDVSMLRSWFRVIYVAFSVLHRY
jgi:methionine aminopeptidase